MGLEKLREICDETSMTIMAGFRLDAWWYAFDFNNSSMFWQSNYNPYLKLELFCGMRGLDGRCTGNGVSLSVHIYQTETQAAETDHGTTSSSNRDGV